MANTKLSDLGEFKLIKHLTKDIKLKNSSTVLGVGDDAAILNYENTQMVVTTDLLTEGIHFDLTYVPLKHLGYKAAVINFSDIYAMNAIPKQMLLSLGISSKFSVEGLEEFYWGVHLACESYGVDLVGGDTSTSLTGLHINITAMGEANKKDIVLRSTAKEGDIICISGDLGAAYMGLQLLERENTLFKEKKIPQLNLQGYDYILERQLKPEARKNIIEYLKEINVKPNSMIDVSDGLSSELFHICQESNVGCKIYENKIPINEATEKMAEEFHISPLTCALNGGEDYELLFTVSKEEVKKLYGLSEISMIGYITPEKEGLNLVPPNGKEIKLKAQGWHSFNK